VRVVRSGWSCGTTRRVASLMREARGPGARADADSPAVTRSFAVSFQMADRARTAKIVRSATVCQRCHGGH